MANITWFFNKVSQTEHIYDVLLYIAHKHNAAEDDKKHSLFKPQQIECCKVPIVSRDLLYVFNVQETYLTHFCLESLKKVINKQYRSRSVATECGVWSGSPLFANSVAIFSMNIKITYPDILKIKTWLFLHIVWGEFVVWNGLIPDLYN